MMGTAIGLATAAHADVEVMTFEGLGNEQLIGNYYNGGGGPNFGVVWGANSLALISGAAGGSGIFSNPPSGHTVAFFLSGPGDVMDVAAGFHDGLLVLLCRSEWIYG